MSSSMSEIIVTSDEPLSVVEIADGRYRLLAQAPRRVALALPPGLYVTRVKYDERVEERLVEHGTAPTQVAFGPDEANKTVARRSDETAARGRQMNSVRSTGRHTWITVSIKAPGLGELPEGTNLRLPDWSKFEIRTLDGQPVVQGSPAPASAEDAAGTYDHLLSYGLDVGWYSLRIPSRDGAAVFLPLFVSPRFSPTVLLEVGGLGEDEAWFDFDRLVVSYDELEGGAYANPVRLTALRAARRSLELGRNGLTDELMQVLYEQKFQDPMLGLFALQLLLLKAPAGLTATDRPVKQFNTVMSNMAGAFQHAQHPDLVLARAQARALNWPIPAMPGDAEPLVAPPLLRANWNALVGLADRQVELVGEGVLRRVGEGLLQTGIWVMWKPPARAPVVKVVLDNLKTGFETFGSSVLREDLVLMERAGSGLPAPPPDRPAPVVIISNSPQGTRAVDSVFEVVVDQVRAVQALRDALQAALQSDPPTGTVLDRAVSRAVLQLVDVDTVSEQNVPRGFSKRLATELAVPITLVSETVERMRQEVSSFDADVNASTSGEHSFLP